MSPEQTIQIQVDQPATRLDQFLAEAIPNLSRSQIQKLIRQGRVLLSTSPENEAKQVSRPNTNVKPGDVITVHLPAPQPQALQPEAIPLDVVFEDNDLVVINKPAGMVVHPAAGHRGAGGLAQAHGGSREARRPVRVLHQGPAPLLPHCRQRVELTAPPPDGSLSALHCTAEKVMRRGGDRSRRRQDRQTAPADRAS